MRLCQDLGRAADVEKYSDALRRAERAAAAAAERAAAAAAAAGGGQQQVELNEGVEVQQQQGDEGPGIGLEGQIAIRAKPRRRAQGGTTSEQVVGGGAEGDAWGSEKLGDDLLPM